MPSAAKTASRDLPICSPEVLQRAVASAAEAADVLVDVHPLVGAQLGRHLAGIWRERYERDDIGGVGKVSRRHVALVAEGVLRVDEGMTDVESSLGRRV
jgi:hypothetical protein